MKYRLLFIPLIILLLCSLMMPALADGYADDASDIRCDNLQFAPVSGVQFTEGNIPWFCSVTLSPQGEKEWLSLFYADAGHFDRVRVVLYRLYINSYNPSNSWQSFYSTLASKDYNSLRSVYFSEGGTVYLPAGNYRIALETLWDGATADQYTTIRSHDFVVYPRPRPTAVPTQRPTPIPTATPAPQNATVTIIHRLATTGQTLYQLDVPAKPGWQTFYPYWGHMDYSLISAPNVQMYIYPGQHSYIYFDFIQNVPATPAPTPVPTRVPTPRPTPIPTAVPTPRPATPVPGQTTDYDPENPFLYGIREYDYCLAPEYCVDPEKEPWNYCYLYSKASDINGRNMGRYEKGDLVKVIKYNGGKHGKYNYCYVITKDGQMGYMHDYALKPIEESQVYYNLYILNNGIK